MYFIASNKQASFYNMINNKNQTFIATVESLSNTFPTFEVSITPNKAFVTQYYCLVYFYANNTYLPPSNKALVSAITDPQLPQINLISSVSTVYLNEPFTLTCTVNNFNVTDKNYTVAYYSNKNGLLATYKVDGTCFKYN